MIVLLSLSFSVHCSTPLFPSSRWVRCALTRVFVVFFTFIAPEVGESRTSLGEAVAPVTKPSEMAKFLGRRTTSSSPDQQLWSAHCEPIALPRRAESAPAKL